jgi:hypothetical protein
VRERRDGETQARVSRKKTARKNRSASLTLCGQKDHLIRRGMNSAFHSENGGHRKAWERERQDRCQC